MSNNINLQKQLTAIRNVSLATTKSGGILTVLRAVTNEIVDTLGYGRVVIGIKHKNSPVLRFRLGIDIGSNDKDFKKRLKALPAVSLTPDKDGRLSSSAFALQNNVIINVEDSNKYDFEIDKTFQDESLIKKLDFKSYLIVPISFENEQIGIIIVDNKHISRPLNNNDITILSALSENLSVSIVNARKYDDLKKSYRELKSARRELVRSQRMYRLMVERGTDAIFILQNYKIAFANKMFFKILGYEEEEVIGKDFLNFITLESKQHLFDSYENTYKEKDQTNEHEYFAIGKDGSRIAIWMKSSLTRYNKQLAILCFARDITEKKKSELELSEAKDYLENILESANDIIYVLDRKGRFTYLNPKMEEFGYKKEELLGVEFLEILSNEHKGKRFKKTLNNGIKQVYEVEMLEKDGKNIRNIVISTSPLHNETGEIEGVLVVGKDITDRKKVEKRLKRLTITDSLTGLYNQRHFFKTLKAEMGNAKRTSRPLCLMMLDIDNFKGFNDNYGHLAGDEVLRTLGKITTKSIRCNVDLAFRYGGDEFAIILPNAEKENAEKVAYRIAEKVKENFNNLEISIGISSLENHKTFKEFINSADYAMYSAKNKGKVRL